LERRIGLELEYPVVTRNAVAINVHQARDIWSGLAEAMPAWQVIRQRYSDAVIGLRNTADGYHEHISNDTGVCTIEIALKPELTLDRALGRAYPAIEKVADVAASLGYSLLCLGTQPRTGADPTRKSQKDAYLSFPMRMPYHHWSVPAASHQFSLDVTAAEAIPVFNAFSALSGLIIGLTASSPIARGEQQAWCEYRTWIYDERSRRLRPADRPYYCNGLPPRAFADWGEYLQWFWASATYFVEDEEQRLLAVRGRRSFSDFLLAEEPVRCTGWDGAMSRVMPDVSHVNKIHNYGWLACRLRYTLTAATQTTAVRTALANGRIGHLVETSLERCYIEFRASGVAEAGLEGSVGALLLGLAERYQEADLLRRERSWDYWTDLRIQASRKGLAALDRGSSNFELAQRMIDIARAGLGARGHGEEKYLDPLAVRLESGADYASAIRREFERGRYQAIVDKFSWHPDKIRAERHSSSRQGAHA